MNRFREHLGWSFIHNCIVHPLMFFVRLPVVDRLHTFTARRAWPGNKEPM